MADTATKMPTPYGRFTYANVFDPDKKGKYGASLIVDPKTLTPADKNDLSALLNELDRAFFEKFPTLKGKISVRQWIEGLRPANINFPVRVGGEIGVDWLAKPEYEGKWVLTMKAYNRGVGVIGRDKLPITKESKEFYSGCHGVAFVKAWAYDNDSKGVSLVLQSCMKIKDGEPLVGGSDPESDFRDIDVDSRYGPADDPAAEGYQADNSKLLGSKLGI